VTVTATTDVGINDGVGFKSTDVGRLIRIENIPADWSTGVTYAKDKTVTGSDDNIYNSVAGANVGHDPTTDDGSHWEVTTNTLQWVWLIITAVPNHLQVTATIQKPANGSTDETVYAPTVPTKNWRLGLYSNSTGWPTAGVYHEGRLWLVSSAFGNRVDGSVSNDHFNFSPTDINGSVAASNAVSAVANAKDVNYFFWLISTEDGLILGSQAGEWRIRASSLDDPISPTSIQMRRVSNWGCANTEPVQASLNVFVQRQRRKLLAHKQLSDQKYAAENLSHLADHLISDGVEQIVWQQEPSLTLWSLLTGGNISGMVFQKDFDKSNDSFNAFFGVEFGDGRTVESISAGPTYDGLSTTTYVVSNQTDSAQPDYNIRWVQCMMPAFDSSSADWEAYLTDGGANPSYMQRMSVANGDSFDGIRIFGLWNLNGRTITPVVGGLDLGDRAVTNGYCDVAFLSDPDRRFTLAFFIALSDGTDYGVFEAQTGYVVRTGGADPSVAGNKMLAYVGDDDVVVGSDDGMFHIDPTNNRCIAIQQGSGTNNGARVFNASTGVELVQAAPATTFPVLTGGAWDEKIVYPYGTYVIYSGTLYQKISNGAEDDTYLEPDTNPHRWHSIGATPVQPDWTICNLSFLHSNGYMYAQLTNELFDTLYKINATTLVVSKVVGCHDPYGSTNRSGIHYDGEITLSKAWTGYAEITGAGKTCLVYCGLWAATHWNEVVCVNADSLEFYVSSYAGDLHQTALLDEPAGTVCSAKTTDNTIFLAGKPYAFSVGGDQTVGLYRAHMRKTYLSVSSIKKVLPADIDATWTAWTSVYGPIYDKSDGNIIMLYSNSTVGQGFRVYVVKHNASTGAIVWSTYWTGQGEYNVTDQSAAVMDVNGKLVLLSSETAVHQIEIVDTTTGAHTTQAINGNISKTNFPKYWDPTTSSITFFGSYSPVGSGPAVMCIGDYLPAHSDTLSDQWARFYTGLQLSPVTTTTTYSVPISIGATYTSQGQLLRPDFGPDAGAQNGPAFGKLRRLHKWACSFWKSRGVSIGTDLDGKLYPIVWRTPGKSVISAPTLYSGIISDTIQSDDGFDAQIAWEVTRPYPVTILAMGGYISSADK
jgi:hypothetical protein